MKILVCKSRNIINIGFIDPDKIHIKTLTDKGIDDRARQLSTPEAR
jgi:hypothetical protein